MTPDDRGKERRRCTRAALAEQLFTGPELAKVLLTLDYSGILATPVIFHNHTLPEYYLCLISILLLVGFFALLSAIFLHKTFPHPAATLGLIGTACVVSVIPAITAGVLPKLGVLVWAFFLLLLVIVIFLVVFVHITGERVRNEPIDPPIAPIEKKLGPEDEAQKAEFCNSDLIFHIRDVN